MAKRLLALLLVACDGTIPSVDLLELECGVSTYAYYEAHENECTRLDVREGALVRKLGEDGCSTWTTCLILQPGELAEHGGTPPNSGQVYVSGWVCGEEPPCGSDAWRPEDDEGFR